MLRYKDVPDVRRGSTIPFIINPTNFSFIIQSQDLSQGKRTIKKLKYFF